MARPRPLLDAHVNDAIYAHPTLKIHHRIGTLAVDPRHFRIDNIAPATKPAFFVMVPGVCSTPHLTRHAPVQARWRLRTAEREVVAVISDGAVAPPERGRGVGRDAEQPPLGAGCGRAATYAVGRGALRGAGAAG